MTRGTGLFFAAGTIAGFFIGNYLGFAVWGSFAGMAAGVILALMLNWTWHRE